MKTRDVNVQNQAVSKTTVSASRRVSCVDKNVPVQTARTFRGINNDDFNVLFIWLNDIFNLIGLNSKF